LQRQAPILANVGLLAKTYSTPVDRINLGRISPTLLHDEMPYNPIDSEYVLNRINQDAAATRRNIVDQSGGNRAIAQAGLLAANRQTQNAVGDAIMQGKNINREMLERKKAFDMQRNQFNAQAQMQSDQYNNQLYAKEQEYNKQAEAARRSAINNLIAGIGTQYGQLATENRWFDIAPQMYGYNDRARFVNDPYKPKGLAYGGSMGIPQLVGLDNMGMFGSPSFVGSNRIKVYKRKIK
jgi:hypothetical protein